jgi:hypothetical protein
MTDSKIAQRQSGNGDQSGASQNGDAPLARRPREPENRESRKANSWDTYRRWLTRVQAPGSGRIPLDPSLYTWKGYRNWSDKVRRDWKPEE